MATHNVFDDLTEIHIQQTWDELTDRFGFDEKGWKKKFNDYLDKQTQQALPVEIFTRFGNLFINPILNSILCRGESHPTFNNLVEYVILGKKKKKK
jgi:hypothetical protein